MLNNTAIMKYDENPYRGAALHGCPQYDEVQVDITKVALN